MKQTILICGASGMVGQNLIDTVPPKYKLLTPSHSELNMLSYDNLYNYLSSNKPDIIIHAAGIVGGIQANIKDPVRFLLENTDMGRNLIWAAYNCNIKKIINIGSSCMYPRNAVNPLKEDSILKGELEPTNEGFAIAKIFNQRLCKFINSQNPNFQYKTIIPCNLYGKHDKFDPKNSHMIPAVIRKIHEAKENSQKEIIIWGDGKARREFMFAEDFANILWKSLDIFNKLPNTMNIGLGKDYTINEYYKVISDVIGFKGKFIYDLSKPVGMKQKLVDNTTQTKLNLRTEHSLHHGLIKTYSYYIQKNQ